MEIIFTKTVNNTLPVAPDNAWGEGVVGGDWSTTSLMVEDHGERVWMCQRESATADWSAPAVLMEWGVSFPLSADEASQRGY